MRATGSKDVDDDNHVAIDEDNVDNNDNNDNDGGDDGDGNMSISSPGRGGWKASRSIKVQQH